MLQSDMRKTKHYNHLFLMDQRKYTVNQQNESLTGKDDQEHFDESLKMIGLVETCIQNTKDVVGHVHETKPNLRRTCIFCKLCLQK